jgi:hypothetical protein
MALAPSPLATPLTIATAAAIKTAGPRTGALKRIPRIAPTHVAKIVNTIGRPRLPKGALVPTRFANLQRSFVETGAVIGSKQRLLFTLRQLSGYERIHWVMSALRLLVAYDVRRKAARQSVPRCGNSNLGPNGNRILFNSTPLVCTATWRLAIVTCIQEQLWAGTAFSARQGCRGRRAGCDWASSGLKSCSPRLFLARNSSA